MDATIQWHLDVDSGPVHTVSTMATDEFDIERITGLLHGKGQRRCAFEQKSLLAEKRKHVRMIRPAVP